MEDNQTAELLIYKYNQKYLGSMDLSNLKIKNSSKETKFIVGSCLKLIDNFIFIFLI